MVESRMQTNRAYLSSLDERTRVLHRVESGADSEGLPSCTVVCLFASTIHRWFLAPNSLTCSNARLSSESDLSYPRPGGRTTWKKPSLRTSWAETLAWVEAGEARAKMCISETKRGIVGARVGKSSMPMHLSAHCQQRHLSPSFCRAPSCSPTFLLLLCRADLPAPLWPRRTHENTNRSVPHKANMIAISKSVSSFLPASPSLPVFISYLSPQVAKVVSFATLDAS